MTINYINPKIAKKIGLKESMVLQHVSGWVKYNAKNNKNYRNGKYWMYQTIRDMAAVLECLSEKQVRDAVHKLIKSGILIKDNFNRMSSDRTNWYTLTEYGWELMCQFGQMDGTSGYNACDYQGRAIPLYKHNSNTEDNVVVVTNTEAGKNGNDDIEYYAQYPVPKNEVKFFEQLLDELWLQYYPSGSRYTNHDMEKVIEYVFKRVNWENDKAIAVYDSTRAELLKIAFEIAHKSGKLFWKYIDGIYKKWALVGIETVADYYYHEGSRELEKSKSK